MSATLEMTRKAPFMEIRRRTFDVLVDSKGAGSFELHDTFETPVAPGRHTLKVREGRYSSRKLAFQVTDGQVIIQLPRTQDYADLSRVIRRSQPGAQAHSGVAAMRPSRCLFVGLVLGLAGISGCCAADYG